MRSSSLSGKSRLDECRRGAAVILYVCMNENDSLAESLRAEPSVSRIVALSPRELVSAFSLQSGTPVLTLDNVVFRSDAFEFIILRTLPDQAEPSLRQILYALRRPVIDWSLSCPDVLAQWDRMARLFPSVPLPTRVFRGQGQLRFLDAVGPLDVFDGRVLAELEEVAVAPIQGRVVVTVCTEPRFLLDEPAGASSEILLTSARIVHGFGLPCARVNWLQASGGELVFGWIC